MDAYYSLWVRLLNGYNNTVLYYLIAANSLTCLFVIIALVELFRMRISQRLVNTDYIMQSPDTPSLSIISPAYNEEASIIDATYALLKLHYPRFEVIVVNDGSKDKTIELLKEEFKLQRLDYYYLPVIPTKTVRDVYKSSVYPHLTVVDKENGGKADSLNTGINVSRHELFCAIDADSLLEEDALLKAVAPFVENKDKVAVSSGIIRIVNGCTVDNGRIEQVSLPKKLLPLFQIVEYMRVFLVGRLAFNALNFVLIVSGAFGIFKKSLVLSAGGYSTNTVGEDMELVVKLHRLMYETKNRQKICFLPDPVCWTEAPEKLKVLSRQRDRWLRGFLEVVTRHKTMVGNPRYGIIGCCALPAMILLELFEPIIELTGYVTIFGAWFLGLQQTDFLILFLIVALLFGLLQSICGFFIEEVLFRRYSNIRDILILLGVAVLENFGYRQYNFFIRLRAFIHFFQGKKGWGKMTRVGFKPKK